MLDAELKRFIEADALATALCKLSPTRPELFQPAADAVSDRVLAAFELYKAIERAFICTPGGPPKAFGPGEAAVGPGALAVPLTPRAQ